MKCEDCLPIIEEYFDGELNAKTAEQIAAHIAGCAECNAAFEALEQEQTLYASYTREIDVNPALWAGVQARINQEAPATTVPADSVRQSSWLAGLRGFFTSLVSVPRFSPALAAALVVVAVGATVVVMSYLQSRSQTEQIAKTPATETTAPKSSESTAVPPSVPDNGNQVAVAPSTSKEEVTASKEEKNNIEVKPVKSSAEKPRSLEAKATKQPDSISDAEQLLRDAERKYVAAITILKRDYDKRRSQLNAETIARFDAALDNIDRTIAATKAAVKKNPGDPIALQYMLAAYAKKVEVLKDINQGS